ncbi:hypothetical protein ACIBEA_43100 [Streptomyces sp. NPDC051555]|uniref:hypothetical protein n=1 Tax=Streptomyces sp. NPDC051555 TaxID=3365657 RepID=UPI0037AF8734
MITPIGEPESRELLDWEKELNSQIDRIRCVIEQAIANFKTYFPSSHLHRHRTALLQISH